MKSFIIALFALVVLSCSKETVNPQPPELAGAAMDSTIYIILSPTDPPTYSNIDTTVPAGLQKIKVTTIPAAGEEFVVSTKGNPISVSGLPGPWPHSYLYLVQDWSLRSKVLAKTRLDLGDYNALYIARVKLNQRWTKQNLIGGCDPNRLPCNWVGMFAY